MGEARYRCDGCGNLTRFDVTISQTTKAFHHYTVGGDLSVEEETVLSRQVDEVVCRWCGHGRSVVGISQDEAEEPGAAVTGVVTERPPAGMVGRLRPIPTYRDHPATTPADIEGVYPRDPLGQGVTVDILGANAPVLLLFLSASCLGCRDLWEGVPALRQELPAGLPVVVVTRGPKEEDPAGIASLAPPGTEVVMSSAAYAHYRVAGPPFLVVVDAQEVRTEGVAWGVAETARAVRAALAR